MSNRSKEHRCHFHLKFFNFLNSRNVRYYNQVVGIVVEILRFNLYMLIQLLILEILILVSDPNALNVT